MKALPIAFLLSGIAAFAVGLLPYNLQTTEAEVQGIPVKLVKASYYASNGFISDNYYLSIQVEPTSNAQPNTKYLFVIDNGIVKKDFVTSWTALEIAIQKAKTIAHKISKDEWTALGLQTSFTTKVFLLKPRHQLLYLLVPGIVALVALISLAFVHDEGHPPSSESYSHSYTPPQEPNDWEVDWVVDLYGNVRRPDTHGNHLLIRLSSHSHPTFNKLLVEETIRLTPKGFEKLIPLTRLICKATSKNRQKLKI